MKFKKVIFSLFLFMGALLVVSSTAYASSSPNVKFVEDGGLIYLDDNNREIDSSTHEMRTKVYDWYIDQGGNMVTVDLRDYVDYIPTKTYTMTINNSGHIDYTGDILWFIVEQDGDDMWFYNYEGFSLFIPGADKLTISWEESAEDYAPVFSGETAFVTTVDNPIGESSIRSYLIAIDETDGNVTHLITLDQDNYTSNNSILGSYTLEYSVTDSSGNRAELIVTVIVKDVLSPTWNEEKDSVSISYTQTFDIEAYKAQLDAIDNYDDASSLVITIDSNLYTASKTIPGSYEVVYKIVDTSGNSLYANVDVNVIDDVKPSFSGPTTISKPTTEAMTITEIKGQLSANDAINGNLTSSIQIVSDEYTGNGNVVGNYDIQFSVTDSSGNIEYHTFSVEVFDNLPPVFYVRDGYFVTVEQSVTLSQQDFIDILEITGQITVSGTGDIEFYSLLNEYEGNETTPGIYALSFRAVSQSGDEAIYNMAVEVMEDSEDPIDVIEEDTFDITAFWNDNKTYIIGGLIFVASLMVVFSIYKKVKKNVPKKKKYKKIRK
ncbi:DUF5011/hyalin repeat domain-containing protein [Mariniplasma anaerobium]|uniref:DUF5011 domain-containing protein n=1 Tax=Mariniplasma anaerobium TaxID=2735436 RepID=A0A7U9XWA0_9MOLU|nr:hypothetical protein [Mariniplasma anaerobium]BCR35561.1 hypothetical protein MPAN_004540 [Mariniplasma anaerobium]